ncbi:hypothetical protein ACQEVI_18870 [Promicromonospora sp. CA-289599]|uniref:hypothetical protein n=1 Tax=Promicromonospora sp. CA-289599 TaxID=3240014 RepID=UPI003D925551
MTTSRITRVAARIVSAVAVAALGVSLAACSAESGPAAGPAASESATATAEPSPTPSPTKTKLSAEEKAEDKAVKQAEKVLREYNQMENISMQAPKEFDPEKYKQVAIGTALSYIQSVYAGVSYAGQHQVGEVQLDSVEVLEVDLTHKPKQTPPEIPHVDFMVCTDISEMDTIMDGKPMESADAKDRLVYRIGVVNYKYPDSSQWLVGYVEYKEDETC